MDFSHSQFSGLARTTSGLQAGFGGWGWGAPSGRVWNQQDPGHVLLVLLGVGGGSMAEMVFWNVDEVRS